MTAFDLGEDELAAFTRPVLDYLPAGFDPECAAQAEIADVDARYELAAQDVAAARVDRIGAPVSEADMCERLLEFGDGRLGIAGLRYRNLDPDFAFIDLKLSFRVQDPATLTSLAAAVSSEYGHLKPRGFTFHEEPGLGFAQADLWTTIMSGSIAAAAKQVGPFPSGLDISWPSTAADTHPEYQHEHAAWRKATHLLAPYVRESSQKTFQESAAAGLLMVLHDDHGFAGLVAGRIDGILGQSGLCMVDLFLTERMRGNALAPVLQAAFLAGQESNVETVWGHIHARNLPSLKTAHRLGRRPVQQEYFVGLPLAS